MWYFTLILTLTCATYVHTTINKCNNMKIHARMNWVIPFYFDQKLHLNYYNELSMWSVILFKIIINFPSLLIIFYSIFFWYFFSISFLFFIFYIYFLYECNNSYKMRFQKETTKKSANADTIILYITNYILVIDNMIIWERFSSTSKINNKIFILLLQ